MPKAKQYRFAKQHKETALKKLYATLMENGSPLHKLASAMTEAISLDKKTQRIVVAFHKKDSVLKEFHVALAKEVLDLKERCFKKDFIEGKTEHKQLKALLGGSR